MTEPSEVAAAKERLRQHIAWVEQTGSFDPYTSDHGPPNNLIQCDKEIPTSIEPVSCGRYKGHPGECEVWGWVTPAPPKSTYSQSDLDHELALREAVWREAAIAALKSAEPSIPMLRWLNRACEILAALPSSTELLAQREKALKESIGGVTYSPPVPPRSTDVAAPSGYSEKIQRDED
jgi:hypothetical protein